MTVQNLNFFVMYKKLRDIRYYYHKFCMLFDFLLKFTEFDYKKVVNFYS